MSQEGLSDQVKLLVTHMNPDMDAIGACWLLRRFDEKRFEGVQLYFVSSGERVSSEVLRAKNVEESEVVHVDTGMGRFDHHQPGHTRKDSATLLVYEYLCDVYPDYGKSEALKRVVDFINKTDHFDSYYWPEPLNDRYMFNLEEILSGLRSGRHFSDHELVEFGMVCLDAVLVGMKIRVAAEEDIEMLGKNLETKWGPALAIENKNDEVVKLGQKMGYVMVIRKDEEKGHMRIKCAPKDGIDLKEVYEKLVEKDKVGTWFYHPSGHMVLNGSRKHANQVATPLSLDEVVELIKNV